MNTFFKNEENQWKTVDNGVERAILGYNNELMTVKVKMQTGAIGPEHSHPHVQTSYIASGKFEMTINGEISILEAGDAFFVQPNILHSCKCMAAGVLIDTFTPAREDFI